MNMIEIFSCPSYENYNMPIIDERFLLQHTKKEKLTDVSELDISIHTDEQSLNFLRLLPNLRLLNLTNSVFQLTDFPALENLQILIAESCNLSNVQGLFSLQNLKQLLLANNQISDLADLLDNNTIEVIDVTNNPITDMSQLSFLTHLPLTGFSFLETPLFQESGEAAQTYLQEKFPNIEINRVDLELVKRAEQQEFAKSVNGGVFGKQQQNTMYHFDNQFLCSRPSSLLGHKYKSSAGQ